MHIKIIEADSKINYGKLLCAHSNGKRIYDFSTFPRLADLMRTIHMVKFQ